MAPSPNQRLANARARLQNMQTGADLQSTQAVAPLAPAPGPSLLDALRYPGTQAAAYLSNGLKSMQGSVQDTINHSPTLSKVKRFFGDIGTGISNGAAQTPAVGQALKSVRDSGPVFRQAQGQR